MASEQDTVAILSEPPNDSQATNPVLQPDNSLNLESGCSNEQMETMAILNVPNGPPKEKQATNPIPHHCNSSIAQESENQGQQLETTEEFVETSIVRQSSRAKGKTTENSTPSNSAEQGIDSNDPLVMMIRRNELT